MAHATWSSFLSVSRMETLIASPGEPINMDLGECRCAAFRLRVADNQFRDSDFIFGISKFRLSAFPRPAGTDSLDQS